MALKLLPFQEAFGAILSRHLYFRAVHFARPTNGLLLGKYFTT
jgi:hypothetical protein